MEEITMNYIQLLFSELRLVPIHFDSSAETEEQNLVKAVTANEELINLGYTLSPKDIAELAKSPDLDGFYELVKSCVGEVKAKPMYPNFPNQVMEIDIAVFRFHQMLHYLSTYGVEQFTGMKVTKGWVPEVEESEKVLYDDQLIASKVIGLVDADKQYILPYKRILGRTERMDNKQKMMVLECLKNLTFEQIAGVKVTFKQNLLDVFNVVLCSEELPQQDKLAVLRAICQHTGDVWKCMDYALTRVGFHFRTSQKRLIVKLLESYPIADFKSNLILSNKKGERTCLMLKFIDFNEYSRKEEFRQAVAAFRNGEMRSWESRAKYLAEIRSPEAVGFYAERPGIMLRNLRYLLRKGYKAEELRDNLMPGAGELKTQTLVSLVNFFSRKWNEWRREEEYLEAKQLLPILKAALSARLAANETVLFGKKVYVNDSEFDLNLSSIRINDKSEEGGYIRSGIAYKIPENVERIRFFVYWNDKQRVDIDLHGAAVGVDGENIYIGWNTNFRCGTLVFSGDMTDSDSAEYIDIDLKEGKNCLSSVSANINIFSGRDSFGEIEECFVGAMAVNQTGEEVNLYDPKNCFYCHYLTGKARTINYGYVDVQNRVIVFEGTPADDYDTYSTKERNVNFSLREYIDALLDAQKCEVVSSAEDAEIVLVMGKPSEDNEVSVTDNNFFMEG